MKQCVIFFQMSARHVLFSGSDSKFSCFIVIQNDFAAVLFLLDCTCTSALKLRRWTSRRLASTVKVKARDEGLAA